MEMNNTMDSMNKTTRPLNSAARSGELDEILRGEISAVEAYEQVEAKVKSDPEAYRLREFRNDHSEAVRYWREQSASSGIKPEDSSSIWGTAVEAFVGLSKLVGEETALRALKKGEEHGLSNYKSMLESEGLTNSQKMQIRNTFIPRQQGHIESINAILKMH